jgi:hypothetical protein
VTVISAWAQDQDLSGADLTVLAVDLPPGARSPGQASAHHITRTQGLLISTIHMGGAEAGSGTEAGTAHSDTDASQER